MNAAPPTAASQGDHDALISPAEQFLGALWRQRVTLAVTFLTTLFAIAIVTFSLPKVYKTHSFLLITPTQTTGSQFAAVELTQTLAKTYAELLQSPRVAEEVSVQLPFVRSAESLEQSVGVSPLSGSQLLQIEAEAGSADEARVIADTYAEVFTKSAETIGGEAPAKLTIAEPAALPRDPSRPKPLLYMLIGTVFAFFVAAGAAILRDRLSRRIDVDSTTTHVLGVPVIGRVPDASALRLALTSPHSASAGLTEPFRQLHTNISFAAGDVQPLSVAIVSAEDGEGKSICAANLASVASEVDGPVLLVDADLRLRSLSRDTGLGGGTPGLSTLLGGNGSGPPPSDVIRRIGRTSLDFLPAGPQIHNPVALLRSPALAQVRRQMDGYSLIVYDCPPLTVASDASLIAASADAAVLVIDAASTNRSAAVQALDQLRRASANVIGVIVNRAPGSSRSSAYFEGPAGRAMAGRRT